MLKIPLILSIEPLNSVGAYTITLDSRYSDAKRDFHQ